MTTVQPIDLNALGLDSFRGRPVTVLGLARSGVALTRFLSERGADVTVYDARPREQLGEQIAALGDHGDVRLLLGPQNDPAEALRGTSLVTTSPSISSHFPTTEPRLRAALGQLEAEGRGPRHQRSRPLPAALPGAGRRRDRHEGQDDHVGPDRRDPPCERPEHPAGRQYRRAARGTTARAGPGRPGGAGALGAAAADPFARHAGRDVHPRHRRSSRPPRLARGLSARQAPSVRARANGRRGHPQRRRSDRRVVRRAAVGGAGDPLSPRRAPSLRSRRRRRLDRGGERAAPLGRWWRHRRDGPRRPRPATGGDRHPGLAHRQQRSRGRCRRPALRCRAGRYPWRGGRLPGRRAPAGIGCRVGRRALRERFDGHAAGRGDRGAAQLSATAGDDRGWPRQGPRDRRVGGGRRRARGRRGA